MKTTICPPQEDTEEKTNHLVPHVVLLHNNEHNSIEWVARVIKKVFKYKDQDIVSIVLEAHKKGVAVVYRGSKEVAELKVEQVRSCGPEPGCSVQVPLKCTIEPEA